jgi:hypothetical protein
MQLFKTTTDHLLEFRFLEKTGVHFRRIALGLHNITSKIGRAEKHTSPPIITACALVSLE